MRARASSRDFVEAVLLTRSCAALRSAASTSASRFRSVSR